MKNVYGSIKMTDSDKKDLKIQIKDIGPLNIDFKTKTNSLNISIFATNGSGKTFISRCFDKISEKLQGNSIDRLDNLVNFDTQTGFFDFEFSDATIQNKLKIDITKNQPPQISGTDNWILHVFNKEFIEKNVEINNYSMNSDSITGEILIGDETIDVTKDETDLSTLKIEKGNSEKTIKTELKQWITKIDKFGIDKRLNEYKDINYEKLLRKESVGNISFEKAQEYFQKIKNYPETIESLELFNYTFDTDVFEKIPALISDSVSVSTISNEFKQKISQKSDFINEGLELLKIDNSVCPFCDREIASKIDLINEYTEYFQQAEAICEQNIKELKIRLQGFLSDIEKTKCLYNSLSLKYNGQRRIYGRCI